MADDVALRNAGIGGAGLWDTVRSWFRGKQEPSAASASATPVGAIEVATGPGVRPGGFAAMAALKAKPPSGNDDKPKWGVVHGMPKVVSWVEHDRVDKIKSVIRGFEDGTGYEAASGLADNMLRDDRIFTGFQKRIGALVGSAIEIKPADSSKKAKRIAEVLGGDDDQPGLWHELFPRAVVADAKLWGILLGIAIIEIIWNYDDPNFTTFTTRVWHPQFLTWNEALQKLQLRTMTGVIDLPTPEQSGIHSDGKWIIYTPFGFRAPWRRALIRPLAMQYIARQWTYRDWSRYSEKHGMPTDFMRMPPNAPEGRAIATQVANRGSEGAVFVPAAGKDEPAYEWDIIETTGESADVFDRFTTKIETNIAVLINGQNLTTEVQGGSYAASKVHEGVELRILLEDAGITEVLRQQALWHWTERNWGDGALTPRVRYIVEEPEDELRTAETLEKVGMFVSALQMAGFDVDLDAIAALWAIPVVPEEEKEDDGATPNRAQLSQEDLALIVLVNEARAAAGLGALVTETGTPNPDGLLTMAEYRAKHAARLAPELPEGGGDPGDGDGEGGQGKGPPAPAQTDDDDDDKGLERLTSKANRVVRIATKQSALRKGHKRMSKYADALKASAKMRASRAMAHDLKDIKAIIDKATNYTELRSMLKAHFKNTDPAAMAKIIERASILANLSGRLSVLEEV